MTDELDQPNMFPEPTPAPPPKKATPKKPKKSKPKATIFEQIAETQALPVYGKSSWGWFAKGVVVTLCMVAILNYGVKRLPEIRDYVGKLSLVSETRVPPPPPEVLPDAQVVQVNESTVVYKIGDKEETRTGGSLSWRLNNPGLIFFGPFAKSVGAIGSDGRYAIFSSYESGRTAVEKLLFESNDRGYKNLSLENALKRYAPKSEGFNTDYYISSMGETGIPLTKLLSDFTEAERNTLLTHLEKIERFTPGKVEVK